MKAARFHGPRDVRVEDVAIPSVGNDQVLVQMRSIGICGTDLSVYRGDLAVRPPITLGHEGAGVVMEVGSDIHNLKAGDRVLLEPSWGCGSCVYCHRGLSLHCLLKSAMGRTVDGAFAEYAAVAARSVHPIAEHVPFDDAQASSTLASAIRGLGRVRPLPVGTAAVVGSGHAGLVVQQLLRFQGARWIAMAGSRKKRLDLARELGADLVVDARSTDALASVRNATEDLGVDLCVDAAATASSLDLSMQLAAFGGDVLLFGIFDAPTDHFRSQEMYRKELRLIGSKGGFGGYQEAAALLARGVLRIHSLISHTFGLDGVVEGFRLMDEKAPDALRIVVHPNG